jgi:pimeloyl-ACP methyl ester carboxylesterase
MKKIPKEKSENSFTSTKKLNVYQKIMLTIIRRSFKVLGSIAPFLAERMALRIFLSPPRHNIPEWHRPFLSSAKKSEISISNKTIKLYQWGSGPSILLVHGWGGRGSQMSAFINPLVSAGYSVFALDGPAHGESSGTQTDMFEFALAIKAAFEVVGSPYAIIAHSFGSACTLLAMREHTIAVSKLILMGCPSSAIWVTENFADKLAISKKIVSGMRKQLEKRYGNKWSWEDLSLVNMIKSINCPILLVHDYDDHEVPYEHALALAKANLRCEVFLSTKQGHRRILRAPEVINKSLEFIKVDL